MPRSPRQRGGPARLSSGPGRAGLRPVRVRDHGRGKAGPPELSRFRAEIAEQPAVARRVLAASRQAVGHAAAAVGARAVSGLVIAARGSSDHAATYAKYLFELRNRLPVSLASPSEYTKYLTPPRLDRFCVLAISQSGSSPDVVAVVREGRRQGAVTLALTNRPDSDLAHEAEIV